MRGSGFPRESVSTALIKIFHEQTRRIDSDVNSQWAMFEVQWELSFMMFEVQWELVFWREARWNRSYARFMCVYARLCARRVPGHAYVRVEFPAMHPLGMLLSKASSSLSLCLAGLLDYFVWLTDAPSVCRRVKWERSSWTKSSILCYQVGKDGSRYPPLV